MRPTRRSDHLLTHLLQVAGEAQGSEDAITKFKSDLNNGPRAAHVVKLETRELDVKQDEKSFRVTS
jgi:acylphosphatase